MYQTIIIKELKGIFQSTKYVATFVTFSILILLSFYTGIMEYETYKKEYSIAQNLNDQNVSEQNMNYTGVLLTVSRLPNVMTIFATGIHDDIGNQSKLTKLSAIKLQHSVYSDDPIFAIFRYIDFTFIVTIVLSLFAIMYTYDAINGEKENGTLKLVFSNSVSRNKFIAAKLSGLWLGLVLPIVLPILLGLLMLTLFNIPITGSEWIKILLLIAVSIIYFTLFIAIGVLVSALTRRSSASFMILLIFWIISVFIIPRVGVMVAGQIISVPSRSEIESQLSTYFQQSLKKERDNAQNGSNTQLQGGVRVDMAKLLDDVHNYSEKLYENVRNKQNQLERYGMIMSRVSPVAAYQLIVTNLAGTDIELKQRTESDMLNYKNVVVKEVDKILDKAGINNDLTKMSFRKKMDSDEKYNPNEIPRFSQYSLSIMDVLNSSIFDICLLFMFTIVSVGFAFFSFQKYDLR